VAKLTNKKGVAPKAAKSLSPVKSKVAPPKVVMKKPAVPQAKIVPQAKAAAPIKTASSAKIAPPVRNSPPLKLKNRPAVAPMRIPVVKEEPVVIPTAAAVPTNGRPRKNLAGITPRELELFRDAILAKRREIVGDMSSMEREALRSSSGSNLSNLPLHMADMGTDNYEQEFTLGLMEKDRKLLRDLNDGLAKIQNGTYGICEGTGKPITKARLEAQPWARYSIEYARKLEKRLR
jgi:DnaK suppressor protein